MTGIIISVAVTAVAALPIGFFCGNLYRRRVAEAEIGSAEAQARKILEDGIKAAETKKKETLIEAKEEILKTKNEFDREVKERRAEISRQERRLASKEETLDKKMETLEKKDETLTRKLKENEEAAAEIEALRAKQFEELQKIAGILDKRVRFHQSVQTGRNDRYRDRIDALFGILPDFPF
jgi:ribonuclease Y